ncbi:MAG: MFS transporter [Gammaproteobacteria bacterium]|nr:MFS transporter [Gammaproteobacteria bacterium]
MSTIVIARKNGKACIAADTLTTFGDIRLPSEMDCHHSKIQTFGGTYMGIVGSAAHTLVAERALRDKELNADFSSRDATFDTLIRLHPMLKEKYFLNAKDSEEDPYESSQIDAVFINKYGIFASYSLREVYEYTQYWAIGTGATYAMGAMHAVFSKARTAREIAKAGAEAGAHFDTSSAPPLQFKTVNLAG